MVIEIGDGALNPTQFTTQQVQPQRFAYETEIRCDQAQASGRSANPMVAMECVIEDLKQSGEFEYVEKDYVFEQQMIFRPNGTGPSTVQVTPNDPLFSLQWHYQNSGDGDTDIEGGAGFVDFWSREGVQGSDEVVVAVVDTGLQFDHPDIDGSPNIVPGWDMVTDPTVANDGDSRDSDASDPGDACPENGIFSDTYHGTHVAGTVGATSTNNGAGIAGGAWSVKIVPVRALGKCGGRLSDINDAIRWAAGTIPEFDALGNEVWNEHPADIINLSIGLFRTCPASLQDAIDDVTSAGAVVVSAAGNDRVSTEFYAPAGCNNVVTVASGDARGYLAPYSNYGDEVDIIAPGGDLTRDDNGDGNPDGVLSSKMASNCFDPLSGEAVETCFYAFEQGTSMAAPHVSAALVLLKSKEPTLSGSDLVSALMDRVSAIPDQNCKGSCTQFPGSRRLPDEPGMCLRPCGAGALDLSASDLAPEQN
ncbi:MAG: S8 family serine peptidase [Pseudomonadota bacterium]